MKSQRYKGLDRNTNTWKYGFLSKDNTLDEVDENSICVSTDLYDSEGIEIYENDIIKWTESQTKELIFDDFFEIRNSIFYGTVVYDNGAFIIKQTGALLRDVYKKADDIAVVGNEFIIGGK